ncbi:Uncharacterised protein [Mycobacteroides abscessus subsp. massiliense]|nr:Uncharacterised protein [Mycobacteroides abscessus subsp. massiliense]
MIAVCLSFQSILLHIFDQLLKRDVCPADPDRHGINKQADHSLDAFDFRRPSGNDRTKNRIFCLVIRLKQNAPERVENGAQRDLFFYGQLFQLSRVLF